MKKLTLFFIITSVLFCSCTDMLELEPENSVTFYNYFKTEKDIETTVFSMHAILRSEYLGNKNYPMLLGNKTDKLSDFYERLRAHDPSIFTSTTGIHWEGMYDVITWANMVIDNIDKAEDLPQDRYDFYKGQAYFVRAFMYFRIIQIFGDAPLVVGIQDNGQKVRTPWKEVLQFAIEDANKAAKMLKPWAEQRNADKSSVVSKQIPGKGTAYALLAHMHAWMGEFGNEPTHLDLAVKAASNVIDGNAEENYAPEFNLASDPEEVVTGVMIGNHIESIFEGDYELSEMAQISHSQVLLEDDYQSWPHRPDASKGRYKNLPFGLLNATVRLMYGDNDKRRDSYFYQFEELENDPVLDGWAVFQKRRTAIMNNSSGWEEFEAWKGNGIIFRLAGIILLRAECYAKKGENDLAIADLNTIRNRAGAGLYSANEGELYKIIFKEREKELLIEDHRYFDCVRTGMWKYELSETIRNLTDQEIADGALFMPISSRAFNNNPGMRQNKYWLGKW
ncbi:hypothetical protein DF185_21965 [Marinifilum breve]|uniref:RagB/SusD family nutrient uptake outer membrane protein n=1 Tax=Marinifilum breve TaxID=2184082 RepID=A0A2V3ZR88_9BACT|nr:RagB/SusD family nutrient uptake outer membrane protein [Marinifilum breve]PXX95387.1 hypothetical protein DF185_21965 [Marinifilum breve]